MSFGLTPHYKTTLYLDSLTHEQFLILAIDIATQLEWNIYHISDAGLIAFSGKSRIKWKGKVTLRIEDDLVTLRSESIGSEMFDWGKNRANIERFETFFFEARNTFSAEDLAKRYEDLKPSLVPAEKDVLAGYQPDSKSGTGSFLSLFLPRKGYVITPILVDLNIAVFLLMAFSGANVFQPSNHVLIKWGANIRTLTLDGQWWRLITNFFLHIGIFHLLLNMYALLFIGVLLEPRLGKTRFAVAYMLTGIFASVTSLYWHDLTISAGASGAIFGMYGVFLAMLTTNLIEKTQRNALLSSIAIFVGYNLIYGLKGGIDSAAHIGGLISGILIGYLYYPGLRRPGNTPLFYSSIGAALILVLLSSFVVYRKTPDDIVVFNQDMRSFAKMERAALSVYKMTSDSPKEQWLSALRDTSIYYWNKNIGLLRQAEDLKVPDELKERIPVLIDYCNLRIARDSYMYKKLDGTVEAGIDSIPYYDSTISDIMARLKDK